MELYIIGISLLIVFGILLLLAKDRSLEISADGFILPQKGKIQISDLVLIKI